VLGMRRATVTDVRSNKKRPRRQEPQEGVAERLERQQVLEKENREKAVRSKRYHTNGLGMTNLNLHRNGPSTKKPSKRSSIESRTLRISIAPRPLSRKSTFSNNPPFFNNKK